MSALLINSIVENISRTNSFGNGYYSRLAFGVWRLAFGVWRLAFGGRRSAVGSGASEPFIAFEMRMTQGCFVGRD
jgi:hypothetical protein